MAPCLFCKLFYPQNHWGPPHLHIKYSYPPYPSIPSILRISRPINREQSRCVHLFCLSSIPGWNNWCESRRGTIRRNLRELNPLIMEAGNQPSIFWRLYYLKCYSVRDKWVLIFLVGKLLRLWAVSFFRKITCNS